MDIQAHQISARPGRPSLLASRRLVDYVKGATPKFAPRPVLNEVTASMPAGRLTAIMGGSGSGKTILLSILAGRNRGSYLEVSGYATYNQRRTLNGVQIAYITQQDILPHNLTAKETLEYAAELRSVWESVSQCNAVVQSTISRLDLTKCADTRIGKEGEKGCSGGERRRISIAIQLLTATSILFVMNRQQVCRFQRS
jgi:ABC-type multidrug transport system ATPase subunit